MFAGLTFHKLHLRWYFRIYLFFFISFCIFAHGVQEVFFVSLDLSTSLYTLLILSAPSLDLSLSVQYSAMPSLPRLIKHSKAHLDSRGSSGRASERVRERETEREQVGELEKKRKRKREQEGKLRQHLVLEIPLTAKAISWRAQGCQASDGRR